MEAVIKAYIVADQDIIFYQNSREILTDPQHRQVWQFTTISSVMPVRFVIIGEISSLWMNEFHKNVRQPSVTDFQCSGFQ